MSIKPVIRLSLERTKKADKVTPNEEPITNYVEIAEEAVSRLGKKLIVGAVAVVATYVVLSVAGAIAVNTIDNIQTSE